MRLGRESRRSLAQFLNGIAVAVIGIGAITPILAGNPSWSVLVAIITGAGLPSAQDAHGEFNCLGGVAEDSE